MSLWLGPFDSAVFGTFQKADSGLKHFALCSERRWYVVGNPGLTRDNSVGFLRKHRRRINRGKIIAVLRDHEGGFVPLES